MKFVIVLYVKNLAIIVHIKICLTVSNQEIWGVSCHTCLVLIHDVGGVLTLGMLNQTCSDI